MTDQQLPPGGVEVGPEPTWDAWSPAHVTRLLAEVSVPWYVAGGWALDLFRGAQTRPHGDLEIAVPAGAANFAPVRRALAGYDVDVVGAGRRWPLDSPAFDLLHQTWVREPESGVYRLDIFREPHDGDRWVCRRDQRISLPYPRIISRTPDGVPYLIPEIVLLFKAKSPRPKDEADVRATLPLLAPAARNWLRSALAQIHPGHAWIDLP